MNDKNFLFCFRFSYKNSSGQYSTQNIVLALTSEIVLLTGVMRVS